MGRVRSALSEERKMVIVETIKADITCIVVY